MPNIVQSGTAVDVARPTRGTFTAMTPFIHIQTTNGSAPLGYQQAGSVVFLVVLISSTTIIPASVVSTRAADGTPNVLWQTCSTAVSDAAIGTTMVVFMGVVHNAGEDIITLGFTGGTPVNANIGLDLFEYNGGYGPNATWLLDVVSSADKTTSTAISFPGHSIRYAVTELFFGVVYTPNPVTPIPSTGMVFDQGSIYGATVVYNLAYPTGSAGAAATQAPTSVYLQMSSTSCVAFVQDATDTSCIIDFSQFIPTGRMWIIYQISYEIQTTQGIRNSPTAVVKQNGRVIETSDVPGASKGPPYYTIRPGDYLTVEIDGAPEGAECVVDILYQEWDNGVPVNVAGVV